MCILAPTCKPACAAALPGKTAERRLASACEPWACEILQPQGSPRWRINVSVCIVLRLDTDAVNVSRNYK
eukprot:6349765-Prymnesium_polylepis.1